MTTTRILRTSPAPPGSEKLGRPIRTCRPAGAPSNHPCERRCAAALFDRPLDDGGAPR